MASLDNVLTPDDLGIEDTLEARAAISRLSVYLNRSDYEPDAVPATIRLAAKTLATSLQGAGERATAGVVTREQSDDVAQWLDVESTRVDSSGLPPDVRSMVAPYRLSPGI